MKKISSLRVVATMAKVERIGVHQSFLDPSSLYDSVVIIFYKRVHNLLRLAEET